MFYLYTYVTENNKLIAQSLYHATSSGILMTVFTILSAASFRHNLNGLGFLLMAFFSFMSVILIFFKSYIIENEKK